VVSLRRCAAGAAASRRHLGAGAWPAQRRGERVL